MMNVLLPHTVPAHQALHCQVELSLGRLPYSWSKRRPGRPNKRWLDHRDGTIATITTVHPLTCGEMLSDEVILERHNDSCTCCIRWTAVSMNEISNTQYAHLPIWLSSVYSGRPCSHRFRWASWRFMSSIMSFPRFQVTWYATEVHQFNLRYVTRPNLRSTHLHTSSCIRYLMYGIFIDFRTIQISSLFVQPCKDWAFSVLLLPTFPQRVQLSHTL